MPGVTCVEGLKQGIIFSLIASLLDSLGLASRKLWGGIEARLVCRIFFFYHWLLVGCLNYNTKVFLLAVVMWALWTIRNKRTLAGQFVRCPSDILFKIHSFLQKWKVLLRGIDHSRLEELAAQVKSWVESFLEKMKTVVVDENLL